MRNPNDISEDQKQKTKKPNGSVWKLFGNDKVRYARPVDYTIISKSSFGYVII